jgi:hypothetical protein
MKISQGRVNWHGSKAVIKGHKHASIKNTCSVVVIHLTTIIYENMQGRVDWHGSNNSFGVSFPRVYPLVLQVFSRQSPESRSQQEEQHMQGNATVPVSVRVQSACRTSNIPGRLFSQILSGMLPLNKFKCDQKS